MTHQAPPSTAFPAYPASWYLYCASSELGRRPLAKTMLGRALVAFRTGGGQIAVMDGRCAHLGADLGGGRVAGESIQCPYHNWEYGTDGRCTRIPGLSGDIPAFARLETYPAEERCGYVFVFNGPKPLFPLPFFFDVEPRELIASVPFRFVADCSWYLFASHAFDAQHFLAVHDRRLLAPPEIDCPAPFARRNRYSALVEGTSVYDRALRTLVSRQVEISITTWGGTLFFLTGNFRHALSRFLVAAQPIDGGRTLAEGVVFARRGSNPLARALLAPISLWVRWLFTRGYLIEEASRLGSPRYSPTTLLESDKDMIDFFRWMVRLPQGEDRGRVSPAVEGPDGEAVVNGDRANNGADHRGGSHESEAFAGPSRQVGGHAHTGDSR
jgi:nitrite reductase/ring-hydroxylating ferredoxin subunit